MSLIKGVILVGGDTKATCFRPLSLDLPKALFPIAGKSLVEHQVEALSNDGKVGEILVIGFDTNPIWNDVVTKLSVKYSVAVKYLCEDKPNGTAGCLYHFKEDILRNTPDAILLFNSDVCCNYPLSELLRFHNEHASLVSVMATKIPAEYTKHFGACVIASKTKELLHFIEKPEYFVGNLINCGIYCISPRLIVNNFEKLLDENNKQTLSPSSFPHLSLERDVLAKLAGTAELYVLKYRGFWISIKYPASALDANEFYLAKYAKKTPHLLALSRSEPLLFYPYTSGISSKHVFETNATIIDNVYIHPSARIHPTAHIGGNVSIAENCIIDAGVRIIHSIVLGGSHIQANACVINSIIGWNSVVGKWCRIEGTSSPDQFSIYNRAPLKRKKTPKNGITILGNRSMVENERIVRNCIVLPQKSIIDDCFNEIIL